MKDGYLQQCEKPRALYERPVNTFVAGFIGSPAMNLCTVPTGSNESISLGGVKVPLPASAAGLERVVLGFRPEGLELAGEGIPAEVEVVEELGADAYVFCASEVAGESIKLVARCEYKVAPARGERVALRPREGAAHVFDAGTGARLPNLND